VGPSADRIRFLYTKEVKKSRGTTVRVRFAGHSFPNVECIG
jgi:hypothetical protein